MVKLIPRQAYVDAGFFDSEVEQLFSKRFFIGSDFDFVGQRYLSFMLGQHAITCRARQGNIHALSNVCLHRCALIDPLGSGEREFRCRYHGWRYDATGVLQQAPMVPMEEITNSCLTRYAVASTDGLHFMGMGGQPSMDEAGALAQRLGWVLAQPFDTGSLEHDCNWKLLVENVIEAYHISFVHTKTFVPAGVTSRPHDEVGAGNYTLWQFSHPEMDKLSQLVRRLPGAKLQYLHGFVFPNLFLATTNNLVGYIGQVLPLSEDKSLLRWQMFALPALQQLPVTVREKICADAVDMNRRILLEDKVILEDCQRGMAAKGTHEYQLQKMEPQIERFHAMWHENMA